MQIVVYTNEDAPAGYRHIAHIIEGKGFHPVVFRSATADGARVAAQDWWDDEVKKAKAALDLAAQLSERFKKPDSVRAKRAAK